MSIIIYMLKAFWALAGYNSILSIQERTLQKSIELNFIPIFSYGDDCAWNVRLKILFFPQNFVKQFHHSSACAIMDRSRSRKIFLLCYPTLIIWSCDHSLKFWHLLYYICCVRFYIIVISAPKSLKIN